MTAGSAPVPAPIDEPGRVPCMPFSTTWGIACKQRQPAISGPATAPAQALASPVERARALAMAKTP
jgi:hypothetical protein